MPTLSERIVGGVMGVGLTALAAVGIVGVATAAPEPAAVVETVAPYVGTDENGLAAEQEAEAAAAVAAEQARIAAEAEAARIAAEAAAQAEAERIAAESIAPDVEVYDEPVSNDEPAPAPEPEPGYVTPGTQAHTICQVLDDGTQVPCQ